MSSIVTDDALAGHILKELWLQSQKEENYDVLLSADTGNKRIPAHRNILSAANEYFRGMFNSSMRESTEKEVNIPTVDGEILKSLIEFIYTGRIEIRDDNAVELLKTASKMFLNQIVEGCENYLIKKLHSTNCFGFMILAEQYNCQELFKNAKSYCLENFMFARESDEFLSLDEEQLSVTLADDKLCVSSEEIVFDSMMSWIQYNQMEREQYKDKLLKCVRMPLLEPSFLINNVKSVCTSTESLQFYMGSIESKLLLNSSFNKRPIFYFTLTISGNKKLKENYIYYRCPERQKWIKSLKSFKYRYVHDTAIIKDDLYIVGGKDDHDNPLDTVICFNFKTMTLIDINQMIDKRAFCRIVAVKHCLYAVGGHNLSSVEKYDPNTKAWSKVASMTSERGNFGYAILNEKLYVVGGHNNGQTLSSAEYYDLDQDVWHSITKMNEARQLPLVSVSNGLLYAMGGSDYFITAECYNPRTKNWTKICSLREGVCGRQFCPAFENKVVVFLKDGIEEYDANKNEWVTIKDFKSVQSSKWVDVFTYSGKLLLSEFSKT